MGNKMELNKKGQIWGVLIFLALFVVGIYILIYLFFWFGTHTKFGCEDPSFMCYAHGAGPYGVEVGLEVPCPDDEPIWNSGRVPPAGTGHTFKFSSCWSAAKLERQGYTPLFKEFLFIKWFSPPRGYFLQKLS